MASLENCPICKNEECESFHYADGSDMYTIQCKYCGEFGITRTLTVSALRNFDPFGDRFLVSGILRNRHEEGLKTELNSENIHNLKTSNYIPQNPIQTVSHLLIILSRKISRPSDRYYFDQNHDYPLLFAKNPTELRYYLQSAEELGYISKPRDKDDGYGITLYGWEHLEGLQNDVNNKRAFVAMSFDESLNDAWENGFFVGIKNSDLEPFRVDLEEHNEKICDRIISEIRNSRLLVADFTGQRGGVYFEAGFALGLDMPVIWTCKSDDIENLHFDTRQYNHIVWDTPEDLSQKLEDRISATILI